MADKLPSITAQQLIAALQRDGWFFVRQRGSHQIYAHPHKQAVLSIPVHRGKDLGGGLIRKTLKDAGLTADDLRRLL